MNARFTVQYIDQANSLGGSHWIVWDGIYNRRHSKWSSEGKANAKAAALNYLADI